MSLRSSYYEATFAKFLAATTSSVIGDLTLAHGFTLENAQRDAWVRQIELLREAVSGDLAGHILFEFAVPRMGKRADTVIVLSQVVLVIEFKVGASTFDRQAFEQVFDYALDLKNFHEGSQYQRRLPSLPRLYRHERRQPP